MLKQSLQATYASRSRCISCRSSSSVGTTSEYPESARKDCRALKLPEAVLCIRGWHGDSSTGCPVASTFCASFNEVVLPARCGMEGAALLDLSLLLLLLLLSCRSRPLPGTGS